MENKPFDWNGFNTLPIVGIVRNISQSDLASLLPHFVAAGFTTIEITMNTSDAEQMISDAIKKHGSSLNVGAGTVCSLMDLERALNAGANFIVTPVVVKDVITRCMELDMPVFPGAFTPTEIFDAWSLGASMIKVFPASTLGPEFIKSIKAPFPQIKLMPTGGITKDSLSAFKKSGADAFGIGSPLFPESILQKQDWGLFTDHLLSIKKAWEKS